MIYPISVPPRIRSVNDSIRAHAGDTVTLTCRAEGQPPPVIVWTQHSSGKVIHALCLINSQIIDKDDTLYMISLSKINILWCFRSVVVSGLAFIGSVLGNLIC